MRDSADNLAPRIRLAMAEPTLVGIARDYAKAARSWTWYQWLGAGIVGGGLCPLLLVAVPWGASYALCRGLFPMQPMSALEGASPLLAIVAGLATVVTLGFAGELNARLHNSRLLQFAACLPVADVDLARYTWRTLALTGLLVAYFSGWALIVPAVLQSWGLVGGAIALFVAIGQGVLCVALGTCLAVLLPHLAWRTVTLGASILLVTYFVCVASRASLADQATFAVLAFTPAGWLNSQLAYGYVRGEPAAALGLVPFWIILGLGFRSYRKLLRTYRIQEITLRRSGEATAVTTVDSSPQDHVEARLWGFLTNKVDELSLDDVDAIAADRAIARIRSRAFLAERPAEKQSLAARGQRFWLSPREDVLFDFLTNDSESWPLTWLGVAAVTGVVLVADLLVGWFALPRTPIVEVFVPMTVGVLAAGSAIVCLHSLASGPWLGMVGEGSGRIRVPRFALVPVGFDEVSRVMFKVMVARLLLFAPFALTSLWLIARTMHRLDQSTDGYWIWGLGMLGGLACLAILALVGQGSVIGWRFYGATMFKRITGKNAGWYPAVFAFSPVGTVFGFILWMSVIGWLSVSFGGTPLHVILTVPAFFIWSPAVWLMIRKAYQAGLIDLLVSTSNAWSNTGSLERTEAKARRRQALRRRYGWLWRLRKPRTGGRMAVRRDA